MYYLKTILFEILRGSRMILTINGGEVVEIVRSSPTIRISNGIALTHLHGKNPVVPVMSPSFAILAVCLPGQIYFIVHFSGVCTLLGEACLYGDKIGNCSSQDCQDSFRLGLCCKTCADYASNNAPAQPQFFIKTPHPSAVTSPQPTQAPSSPSTGQSLNYI